MIKFHYATLDDKARIDELLHNSNERGCEYSFTNLFAWSAPYQLQVASVEGCLTTHMTGVIGPCYLYPVGGDTKAAILALAQDAAERGEPLRLAVCPPNAAMSWSRSSPAVLSSTKTGMALTTSTTSSGWPR